MKFFIYECVECPRRVEFEYFITNEMRVVAGKDPLTFVSVHTTRFPSGAKSVTTLHGFKCHWCGCETMGFFASYDPDEPI